MTYYLKRVFVRIGYEISSPRFWRFLLGTIGGLVTDLVIFNLLTSIEVPPGISNVISATTGLLVVYFLVTRYAFKTDHNHIKFIAFVCWYGLMISFWGVLIQQMVVNLSFLPIVAKLITVPFSFSANFVFSRVLFGQRFWKFITRHSIAKQDGNSTITQ